MVGHDVHDHVDAVFVRRGAERGELILRAEGVGPDIEGRGLVQPVPDVAVAALGRLCRGRLDCVKSRRLDGGKLGLDVRILPVEAVQDRAVEEFPLGSRLLGRVVGGDISRGVRGILRRGDGKVPGLLLRSSRKAVVEDRTVDGGRHICHVIPGAVPGEFDARPGRVGSIASLVPDMGEHLLPARRVIEVNRVGRLAQAADICTAHVVGACRDRKVGCLVFAEIAEDDVVHPRRHRVPVFAKRAVKLHQDARPGLQVPVGITPDVGARRGPRRRFVEIDDVALRIAGQRLCRGHGLRRRGLRGRQQKARRSQKKGEGEQKPKQSPYKQLVPFHFHTSIFCICKIPRTRRGTF